MIFIFTPNGRYLICIHLRRLKSNKVKVKVTLVQKLRLCTGRTTHSGSRGIALPFHDHDTRRGWAGQRHASAAIYPRERPGTHCTGGWVGPRAGLDSCGKSRPPPGFDPRTVQPVASRYTDWATGPFEVECQGDIYRRICRNVTLNPV